MSKHSKVIAMMRNNPRGVRFEQVKAVCDSLFGLPRNSGTSHHVYAMPWGGDPRVVIQERRNGKAKAYQVRQILAAIDRMEDEL